MRHEQRNTNRSGCCSQHRGPDPLTIALKQGSLNLTLEPGIALLGYLRQLKLGPLPSNLFRNQKIVSIPDQWAPDPVPPG